MQDANLLQQRRLWGCQNQEWEGRKHWEARAAAVLVQEKKRLGGGHHYFYKK